MFNELFKLTMLALNEVDVYISKYGELSAGVDTKKVLLLLKKCFEEENINERVLRGFKDICTTIAITNEDASFAPYVFKLSEEIEKRIPKFKQLDLLRMDFGKGNPI